MKKSMTELDLELHTAAREGDTDGVASLISRGADPNAIDPGDWNWGGFLVNLTPLMRAINQGSHKCVRMLIDAGADINRKDTSGKSARDYARDYLDSWESIAKKSAKRDFTFTESKDRDELHQSALAEAEEIVRLTGCYPVQVLRSQPNSS